MSMDERMPEAQLYEEELKYMPYKESLHQVIETICQQTPRHARLVDLMCGTGYMLGQISKKRPDLYLHGVDIDQRYITHARENYPSSHMIKFESGDVLTWQPSQTFDVVTCTGALHHVDYPFQGKVVDKMAQMLNKSQSSFALVSDCYIADYNNEGERQIGAAQLGYEYLKASIKNGAPQAQVQILLDILNNDVLKKEFKTSISKRTPSFNAFFNSVQTTKIWPIENDEGYGDYISILRGPKK